MTMKLNRRKFMTSALAVSGTAIAPGASIGVTTGTARENAVTAILKKRLPRYTLDEESLQRYAEDVVQRLSASRNKDGKAFSGIFRKEPSSLQMEHFIVQDFLVHSNVFAAASRNEPVAYQAT